LEVLAEEFVARYRRGERPALSEYIDAHPELADEIRELFPTLVVIEELAPSDSDASVSPTVAAVEAPRLSLGDYRILREIGRGGMGGIVYEAEQLSLGRRVALKVLRHTAIDATVRQRFHREARAAAQLHHTNIVPVFEVGEDQDTCWYAMQLIVGQGLDQIIEELRQQRLAACRTDMKPAAQVSQVTQSLLSGQFDCPALDPSTPPSESTEDSFNREPQASAPALSCGSRLKEEESASRPASHSELSVGESTGSQYYRSVARIGRQAAEGLAHAHARGIIHRDIKPSNLLLDAAGVVWITDFGLAKTQDVALTSTGDIVGTLRYMAPERLQGEGDERADVYALGLTLYELLVLRPSFEARDRLQLVDRIKNEEPIRPRTLDRRIPRDLETIILTAIHKEPKRRYQTAEAMAEDLRRFLANEPIKAKRTSHLARLRLWSRRNPALAALLVVLALFAAGATTTAFYLRVMLNESEEAHRQEKEAKREARLHEADALVGQAHVGRFSRQPGQRLDSLKALERAAQLGRELGRGREELLKLRNEAIACLALQDVRLEKEWEGNPPGTNGLGFDARFERYAWSFKDEGIRICRVADQQELLRLPTLPAERVSRWLRPRFSPDGRFLAVWYSTWASQRPLQVWELKSGVSQPLLTLADAATQPEFSPDGRTLAIGMPDKSLRLFDLTTGQETKRVPLDLLPERLAFHPDGQKIALSSTQQHGVQVRDLLSGRVMYSLPHPAGVQAVAWHPRGQLLATGCDDHLIYLWDGSSGERQGVLEGHSWEVHDLAFDNTGEQLASFCWDMTLWLWDVATRKPLWQVENIRVFSFCREGPLQAAGISGRQVRLWTCVPSPEFHMFRGPTQGLNGGALVSPDGRFLYASAPFDNNRHPELWIWDLRGEFAAAHFVDVHPCGWDAEGHLLLTTKQGQLVRRRIRYIRDGSGDRLGLGPAESLLDQPLGPGLQYGGRCGRDCRLVPIGSHTNDLVQMFVINGTARKLWERVIPNWLTFGSTADGRWFAVGTQDGGRGVSIFEAHSGKLVKELVIGDASPAFSPDGRWLVTTSGRYTSPEGECCLWRTDTWEPVYRLPLHWSSSSPPLVQVSPDGTMVAVAFTMSEIRLLRLETLEEIATLTAPAPGINLQIEFSPDGRQLLNVRTPVHAWDLHALRQGLRGIGLDWEMPGATESAN
jgi:serine/threonine protein kinase/WD40 repeat protein